MHLADEEEEEAKVDKNFCVSNKCGDDTFCIVLRSGYRCAPKSEIDYCASATCLEGQTCLNKGDGFCCKNDATR